jgi:pyridoxal phosphate enzyme (YggS family)
MTDNESEKIERVAGSLQHVRARIETVCARAGRDPASVALVAVSKTQPFALVEAAYAAGQRDFGENRLEELWSKVEAARNRGLDEIRWHLIGPIQSRKTGQAVGPFTLIHALDRVKIARRLSSDAMAAGKVLDVLLEVNISGEESKHGFAPDELRAVAATLGALPGLRVAGLMTMAPLVDDAELTRPVFRGLRELRDELAQRHPKMDWRHLSMGMTNDFEVAVEEGATIVRIGSAIFGPRAV